MYIYIYKYWQFDLKSLPIMYYSYSRYFGFFSPFFVYQPTCSRNLTVQRPRGSTSPECLESCLVDRWCPPNHPKCPTKPSRCKVCMGLNFRQRNSQHSSFTTADGFVWMFWTFSGLKKNVLHFCICGVEPWSTKIWRLQNPPIHQKEQLLFHHASKQFGMTEKKGKQIIHKTNQHFFFFFLGGGGGEGWTVPDHATSRVCKYCKHLY